MKANNNDHNQIMALDIGSSKVSCVIARSQINKKIFIEGISSISYRPSNENKSSDNQEMIEAIKESFFSANTGSSTKIQSVIVGLSGTFINSTNVNLNIPRSGNVKLVTQSDIDNAVKIAKHIDLEEFLFFLDSFYLDVATYTPSQFLGGGFFSYSFILSVSIS